MTNKPSKFSFYDVRKIPENLMDFDFIKEIDYDIITKEVTLTYRSGIVLPLGSVDPGTVESLTGASLNDQGELIFTVSDGSLINAGRVVADYYYEDDYVSGTGLLSSEPGVYKPLVSGSHDLAVSMNETELSITATFPGESDLSVLDETRIYNSYTWLVETSPLPESSYVINTWHTRKLNDSKVNNLNVVLNNSTFVLTKGTYYISGFARSYRGGRTKIALRDVINNTTIIDSVGAANFQPAVSSSVKNVISGYVFLEDDTTVALQQMLSNTGAGSILGANPAGTQLASVPKFHSELNIWKLSDEILPPSVLPEEPIDPLIAALQRNYYLNIANSMTASTSTMGASLAGVIKWSGGVLGPDGKIYCIPRNSADILVIDPISGTATRSTMGTNLSGTDKWLSGVLGPDGKIYGIPYNATDILIIDPVAGTATRSNMGASLSGATKWIGGCLGPDGKIYGMPFDSTDILIIDPVSGIATRSNMGAVLGGNDKWAGGVLGPDGKIYGMPFDATDILIIDPIAGTATRSNMGAGLGGTDKWIGGVLSFNGTLYSIPYVSGSILRISPTIPSSMPGNVTLSPYLNKY